MKRDFILFGGVAIQPLSVAIASGLIMQHQLLHLVPYALPQNKKCPVIVTWVKHSSDNGPKVGSIVEEINGVRLANQDTCADAMKEVRRLFDHTQEKGEVCTADTAVAGAEKAEKAEKLWSLKTTRGEWIGVDWKQALTEMASKPRKYLADVVVKAISAEGIELPEDNSDHGVVLTEAEEVQAEEMASDPDKGALPIEDRDFYRGGMSAAEALRASIDPSAFSDSLQLSIRTSFLEIGPGGMAPSSLMQMKKKNVKPLTHP
jgi:hypothetical protein